ncbi:hypothetical protein Droror1_Dr00018759 [Drosera rotundifolia]
MKLNSCSPDFISLFVAWRMTGKGIWGICLTSNQREVQVILHGEAQWQEIDLYTGHGHADIKATFGKGQKHELNVSTYQMCILMLFNKNDQLTFKETEDETKIPTADLKRCLKSLACVKRKNVLTKEPASADIGENDVLCFNDKFTSKHYKLKIGIVTAQESDPEKQSTMRKVDEDRKHIIVVAVVQVMKSRRRMQHSDLLAEVTEQLQSRFLPQPTVIKKRIESLIDRDYLERDKDDAEHQYLATTFKLQVETTMFCDLNSAQCIRGSPGGFGSVLKGTFTV